MNHQYKTFLVNCWKSKGNIYIHTDPGGNRAGAQVVFHTVPAMKNYIEVTNIGYAYIIAPQHKLSIHSSIYLSIRNQSIYCIPPVFGNGHESLLDVFHPEGDSHNRSCMCRGSALWIRLG